MFYPAPVSIGGIYETLTTLSSVSNKSLILALGIRKDLKPERKSGSSFWSIMEGISTETNNTDKLKSVSIPPENEAYPD